MIFNLGVSNNALHRAFRIDVNQRTLRVPASAKLIVEDLQRDRRCERSNRLCCKPRIGSRDGPDLGLEFSCSGRFEFEPFTDELRGFGQCAGAETEGALDEARLTANVAGDVEDCRLVFAERAHHLEAFDRRIGRLQRLEASDRADQLLQLAVSACRDRPR